MYCIYHYYSENAVLMYTYLLPPVLFAVSMPDLSLSIPNLDGNLSSDLSPFSESSRCLSRFRDARYGPEIDNLYIDTCLISNCVYCFLLYFILQIDFIQNLISFSLT